MSDRLYPWILKSVITHNDQHGADLKAVVYGNRYCQLLEVMRALRRIMLITDARVVLHLSNGGEAEGADPGKNI